MLAHLLRAVLNDRLGHYVAELPRYFRDRLLPGKRVKLSSHGGKATDWGCCKRDFLTHATKAALLKCQSVPVQVVVSLR